MPKRLALGGIVRSLSEVHLYEHIGQHGHGSPCWLHT